MNKLHKVIFSGYKSFYDETALELGDLNILIGANQSGKSAVLDLFELLHQASRRNLQTGLSERGGIDNLLSWDAAKSLSIRLSIGEDAESPIRYELEIVKGLFGGKIQSEKFNGLEIHNESFLKEAPNIISGFDASELSISQLQSIGREGDGGRPFQIFIEFLRSLMVHHYFNTSKTSRMRDPDFIGTHISGLPPTRLAQNGDNLTSVLYLLN